MANTDPEKQPRSGTADEYAGFVDRFKERGKEQIEAQKDAAAEQVSRLAHVVERATEELRRGEFGSFAQYAGQLATKINALAEGLRRRKVEDLIDDTRRAARKNPEMFFLGSIGAGLLLSRFFKASERKQWEPAGTDSEAGKPSKRWEDLAPAHNRPSSATTANILAGGE